MTYCCRICQANTGKPGICENCGFDNSLDCIMFPTILDIESSQMEGLYRTNLYVSNRLKLRCSKCGGGAFSFFLEDEAIVCVSCGKRINNDELPQFLVRGNNQKEQNENAPSKTSIHDRLVTPKNEKGNSEWTCECGYKNDVRRKYCENCDAPRKTKVIEKQANTSWTCICGYRNAPERHFCENCDHPRRYYF